MKKSSVDYFLVLATAAVLFLLGVACIYGMIAFKLAAVHQLPPAARLAYLDRMNTLVAPLVIGLLLLLGVCVPKRLLPLRWLFPLVMVLLAGAAGISLAWGVRAGLLLVVCATLLLQAPVLVLALGNSDRVHFQKKGYWVRLGSALVHLGLILFVLDLFFYRHPGLHLLLFWVTTGAMVSGLLGCFYAETMASLFQGRGRRTEYFEKRT